MQGCTNTPCATCVASKLIFGEVMDGLEYACLSCPGVGQTVDDDYAMTGRCGIGYGPAISLGRVVAENFRYDVEFAPVWKQLVSFCLATNHMVRATLLIRHVPGQSQNEPGLFRKVVPIRK